MGRPRKEGSKDLPTYLSPRRLTSGSIAYTSRFPGRKPVYHGTDKQSAIRLHNALWERIAEDIQKARTEKKLALLQACISEHGSFASLIKAYRVDVLPKALGRTGKPLSKSIQHAYKGKCLAAERWPDFTKPPEHIKPSDVRKFLAQWIEKPASYNQALTAINLVFKHLIVSGAIDNNPCREIDRLRAPERRVYIPDDDYIAITSHLEEWQAKTCDFLYATQARPGNALAMGDANLVDGELRYRATKNGRLIHLTCNQFTLDLIDWFRKWKREQWITADTFIVYPSALSKRRLRGKPVSVAYLSRAFASAAVAAGFDAGQYKLKDLRKKGETDERKQTGKASGKLGDTAAMDEYYNCEEVPTVARIGVRVDRGY